jgi:signal transduction histidine kinase/DNA-binding response OmpR family regulator
VILALIAAGQRGVQVRDVVTLVVEVAFALVFCHALVAYVRGRDPLQRDVMLVFTAMATIFGLEVWRRVLGPPPAWLGGISSVLLLAQPYLTLRLVAQLRSVARPLRLAALIGFGVTGLPFALGRPMPPVVVLAAVAVFVAVETVAAGFLYREARRRSGSPRIRLMAAAAGTAAFAVAILAAGAGAAGPRAAAVAGDVALAVALASGVAYLVAFVPPRWLRQTWSTSAAYTMVTSLLEAPAGESPERIWQRYADTVCAVTASDTAVVLLGHPSDGIFEVAASPQPASADVAYPCRQLDMLLAAPQPVAVPGGSAPELAVALAARVGACYVRAVPLGLRSGGYGALVLLNTHRRLFPGDDVVLLGQLGAQAGLIAERGALLAEHERLNNDLAASVDALSMASKAKSDFLANMSHELRTPLNAILGFSELMDTPDGDPHAETVVPLEWIRHIRRSGRHLLDLISDILDLAKVEAGRIELKPEPLPLPATITDVVTTLRAVSDRKRLQITTDVPALTVTADRIRLRQILDNLLSNAIKFTPEDGRIHLSADHTDTEVRITVTDTGVGITADDHAKVFEEFAQVGDPTARQAGTGLGLTLTRRLVEAHGGLIELQSQPGQGSAFTVCLPGGTASTTTRTSRPADRPPQPGAVLIIEDDPAAAALLRTHLTDIGYPVDIAPTGQQGLDYARQHQPRAILLDLILPDLDGWQVLREIRTDPTIHNIPVIITTVVDDHNIGVPLGAVDYLIKPVNPEVLIAILNRHAVLPTPGKTTTALAIDDDPATLDLLTATLARHGTHTHTAATGSAGLALARQHPYDLIICDLLLPDTDGFAVIAALHTDPASTAIPILVLTGADLTDSDRDRLAAHVLDIVGKDTHTHDRLSDWLDRLHHHAPA